MIGANRRRRRPRRPKPRPQPTSMTRRHKSGQSGLGYPCLSNVWFCPLCSLPREPFKPNTLWPGNPPSSSQRASILLPTLHSLRPRGLAALELRASLITSYSPTRARRGRPSSNPTRLSLVRARAPWGRLPQCTPIFTLVGLRQGAGPKRPAPSPLTQPFPLTSPARSQGEM